MSDKLFVEVDFNDSRSAIYALIHLAHLLAESSTVHITDNDNAWEQHEADEYSIKWRFAENEMLSPSQSETEFDLTLLTIPKRRVTSRRGYL